MVDACYNASMKVMIIGSMRFAKEMMETKAALEKLGHTADVPCDTDLHVEDPGLRDDFERDAIHVKENDIMHRCFALVAASDAVLVLNYKHNGIEGYVGASALMEAGIAAYLKKGIYLLNPVVERYKHEFAVLDGVIINGDLSQIPK